MKKAPILANLSPIEAHERVIARIFSDDYAFEIPAYQRPYAWEVEQARDLLNDLLDAMDNGEASGGVYFMGSIVLIKSPASAAAKVVDGQQRLTTLTLLLSVMRDLTSDPARKLNRTAYIHQAANPDTGAADRHRLLLRERDRDFFHAHVQRSGATDTLPSPDALTGSQQRLIENAAYLGVACRISTRDAVTASSRSSFSAATSSSSQCRRPTLRDASSPC